ncbi:MAG: SDR family NAD(P)-dependent oxidoreductase, partial [Paraburkholderia tropica]
MKRFEGKTVVVTGGGGGIGGAACRRFAAEGARVAVLDLSLDAAQQVTAQIVAQGGTALALHGDITVRADVNDAIAQIEAKLGPVDVLVNNAGWDVFKPFTKTTPVEWERLIAINLVG